MPTKTSVKRSKTYREKHKSRIPKKEYCQKRHQQGILKTFLKELYDMFTQIWTKYQKEYRHMKKTLGVLNSFSIKNNRIKLAESPSIPFDSSAINHIQTRIY